jgi:hypothetical protein
MCAWYNNWGDLVGDVKDIASGHNPANHPPPVNIPDYGASVTGAPQPHSTGQSTMAQTSDPTNSPEDPGTGNGTDDGSGTWDWLKGILGDVGSYLGNVGSYLGNHAGDILKTGGSAANAYLQYIATQQAIAEKRHEFDLSNQLAQNRQAADVSNQLNRLPLADRGQYMAMNAAAPTPFVPRDYTQGLNNINGQATGGAAAQVAANAAAAGKYTPGAGGVNSDTLKMILARLGGPSSNPLNGATPVNALPPGASTAANGNTMTEAEYQAWRKAQGLA